MVLGHQIWENFDSGGPNGQTKLLLWYITIVRCNFGPLIFKFGPPKTKMPSFWLYKRTTAQKVNVEPCFYFHAIVTTVTLEVITTWRLLWINYMGINNIIDDEKVRVGRLSSWQQHRPYIWNTAISLLMTAIRMKMRWEHGGSVDSIVQIKCALSTLLNGFGAI